MNPIHSVEQDDGIVLVSLLPDAKVHTHMHTQLLTKHYEFSSHFHLLMG
jgi:hypothetical protein